VEVRQVWAHNFEAEAKLIESLLPKFRYAAVDTEFPGTVYRPAGAAYMLTPERRYELLKMNVDAMDLIQLGLTLFDSGGRLPSPGGGGAAGCVWEFNFREFDVQRHRHAPESIAMLRAKGVDFDRTRRHGVDAAAFGPRLRKWLRAGLGRDGVVTFSGGYDLAYLVKVIYGPGYELPSTAAQFEGVARSLLRRRLFDVKEMARLCPADLRGGLDTLAVKLAVVRAVGEAHQAGSDSLLTCHTFMKMRDSYFADDGKLARVAGVLTDITAY
jgi:CCR4-NOT transcription complex subunit 7/8